MVLPALPILAAGALDGLLLLAIAILGFGLVAVVAVVVLALIHAVLPSADGEGGDDPAGRSPPQPPLP